MAVPLAATMLALWLILWAIYHLPYQWLNVLLVMGLVVLVIALMMAHEDDGNPPENQGGWRATR